MSDLELPQGITAADVNGLPAWRIDVPGGRALVYAQGAHVAEWAPAGADEVLWLSEQAVYSPGKAIRGGVPICFPWFGPGRSGDRKPAHGFARTATWRLVGAETDEQAATLRFEITGDDVADLGGFPADFTASYSVQVGKELVLALTVTAGEQPLDFEEALHSYFTVDATGVRIGGLEGAGYLDKVTGTQQVQQGEITFTGETDRVYSSEAPVTMGDDTAGRVIVVDKVASSQTVVWNPWVDKSAAMGDFGDDEWQTMCCVETANCVDGELHLAPGESHTMVSRTSLA